MTYGSKFVTFQGMNEGSISISAKDRKFRVVVYSPTDWHAGMKRPVMTVELFPVFHRESVSFNAEMVGDLPDVVEGLDPTYVAGKVMSAIKAEIEAEGELPNDKRKGDWSWILSSTDGYIRPGFEYRVIVWFVTDTPGKITAMWIASTDAVSRDATRSDEPKGHRYKV